MIRRRRAGGPPSLLGRGDLPCGPTVRDELAQHVGEAVRVGARKPVLYELRNSTSLVGCQRTPTFGLKLPPTSL